MDLQVCVTPTISGNTDGKCRVYFTADPTTASGWADERSHLGASSHLLVLDAPVFGQDYQCATSEGISSTSSSTFQDKLSITTPALTGTYLVSWQCILKNIGGSDCAARLQNTTDALTLSGQHKMKTDAVAEHLASGFGEVVFSGAAKTFKIQFQAGGNTTEISQARTTIWRVG